MSIPSPSVPLAYVTPSWPSLYWPINVTPGSSYYLYYVRDIWRFTLYWTLFIYLVLHLLTSVWAVLMLLRSAHARRQKDPDRHSGEVKTTLLWVWAIPMVYLVVGGVEALLAGSLMGLVLGAVYNAAFYRMSTWTPLLWGLVNALLLILSSFSIQGGL